MAAVVEGAVDRRARRRDAVQHFGDRGHALLLDIFAVEDQDGLRGFGIDRTDARTGDFDAVERGGFLLGRRGVLRERSAGDGGARDKRERDRVAELGGLKGHLSLQVCLGNSHGNPAGEVKKDAKSGKVGRWYPSPPKN